MAENKTQLTTGKSCLYINKIADINVDVLKELGKQSVAHMREINN